MSFQGGDDSLHFVSIGWQSRWWYVISYLLFYSSKFHFSYLNNSTKYIKFSLLFLFLGPGVGSKRLGLKTMAAIIFARLLLVPPVGLGIVTLADKLNLFPKDDKMFKFVLLLQHSMPTSVLSGNHLFLNFPIKKNQKNWICCYNLV